MNENRTLFGKITYFILLGTILVELLYFIGLIIEEIITLPSGWGISDVGLIISILLFAIVISLIALLPAYLSWRAFKLDSPKKLRGVLVFYIIASAIVLIINWLSTIFKIGDTFDYPTLMLLIINVILVCEVKSNDASRLKNIWVLVGILGLIYYFGSVMLAISNSVDNTLYIIFTPIQRIFISVGFILLSYWIKNREAFYNYEFEEEIIYEYSVEEIKDNYSSQLKELKGLLDDGLITQEDYDKKKQKILGL